MMVCDQCGQTGIRWMGPIGNLTHTECPHCGGTNCQRPAVVTCEQCEGEGICGLEGELVCEECGGAGILTHD